MFQISIMSQMMSHYVNVTLIIQHNRQSSCCYRQWCRQDCLWTGLVNTYGACLIADNRARVTYSNSSSVFCFGDGGRVQATTTAHIPAYIGNQQVPVNTDIVDRTDIPFLHSPINEKAIMQISLRMTQPRP